MNHYEILGVEQTATSEEIKKAYRKLSLKFHPDKTSDPEIAEKYKSINEAYAILGNSSEKQKYDFEQTHKHEIDMLHPMFGGMSGIKIFTTHDMPPFGMDSPPIDIDSIFNMLHGFSNNKVQKPNPIIYNITIEIEQVLTGTSIPVSIERWIIDNRGVKINEVETIYVDVPKGIDDNEVIILYDKGNSISNSNKGDVKVIVHINNQSNFVRNGLDLIYTHKITLKEALCGFKCNIPHLNGNVYSINNTKGKIIYDNYKTTINNLGLVRNDHTGNLHILFCVEFPTSLTSDQIEGLKKIL
jgi:DnaJ family protein B protein 4